MNDKATVRKCKAIRDHIYRREELSSFVLERTLSGLLSPECTVVDVGCGRKATLLRSLSPRVKKAYGIDRVVPKATVEGNTTIVQGDAEAIPLPDRSADVVTMIDVVEHLRDPERAFRECRRILKPRGSLLLRTPSKYYPPTFVGRALPHRIRQWANLTLTRTRRQDTFPAYYRANSYRDLRRLSSSAGLEVVSIQYVLHHPALFMFSPVAYRCAVAVERFVLQRKTFRCFRHRIFCHLMRSD